MLVRAEAACTWSDCWTNQHQSSTNGFRKSLLSFGKAHRSVFSGRPAIRVPVWLARLLSLSGDIEPNPGPHTTAKTTTTSITTTPHTTPTRNTPHTPIFKTRNTPPTLTPQPPLAHSDPHYKPPLAYPTHYDEPPLLFANSTPNDYHSPNKYSHLHVTTYSCRTCSKPITNKQTSIQCNHTTPHWLHLKCTEIKLSQYTQKLKCQINNTKQHTETSKPTHTHTKQHNITNHTNTPKTQNLLHPNNTPIIKTKSLSPETKLKPNDYHSPNNYPHLHATRYSCQTCSKPITNKQTSIQCNHTTPHWLHLKCTEIKLSQYTQTWKCQIHNTQQHTETSKPTHTHTKQHNITNHTNTPKTQNLLRSNKTPIIKTKSDKPETKLKILQININGLSNKIKELELIISETKADIITIQETKLTSNSKSPKIPNYTEIRKDRLYNKGGGLLTYIKNNITFTNNEIPENINQKYIELQIITLHLSPKKTLKIINIYIPPCNSTNQNQTNEDAEITHCINTITSIPNSILSGDINAHSTLWYSNQNDHRGTIIADVIQNSDHITLNTNTHTRLPYAKNQNPSSPDITSVSSNLYPQANWETIQALSSDHIPILTTIDTKCNYKLKQHRNSYTNYKKADWTKFTNEIEDIISKTSTTDNVHIANRILTNAILTADKHHIPKGKINENAKLLPEHIRQKITHRNLVRQTDAKDKNLPTLNQEIDKLIETHKSDLWKEKLNDNWDHKQNTHKLWNTINQLSNKKPKQSLNRTITFGNKNHISSKQIATAFNKQFTNPTKYTTNKNNRIIDRHTKQLKSTYIQISTEQVIHAIKTAKNNNSTGPDNLNIKHLKYLGPKALEYLRSIVEKSLNTNVIPEIWKLAKIVPILKPNKNPDEGTSYRPISLLSPIVKILEKIILPDITQNIPNTETQHGFKKEHSTSTALHNIHEKISQGFNMRKPHHRTIMVALDMSKAFDTVNTHTLIKKIQNTNIPPTIIKFIANYVKGRKAYTVYNNTNSKQLHLKTGVPQGGVLSPILFNIYMSDIPTPPDNIYLHSYADDITTLSLHYDIQTAQDNLEPYLEKIYKWTKDNDLKLNADKSTSTLFTLHPNEFNKTLNLHINNTLIPTVQHPKILGVTFDPKLTYNQHIDNTKEKANKTTKLLKALTSTNWGKQKETIVTTYKTISRPIIEHASTIWSSTASKTNINKLQTVQNTALRIATGCTADTNTQHLHNETLVLPLKNHLQLQASQILQKSQLPSHPLHKLIQQNNQPRHIKTSIFQTNNTYTQTIPTDSTNTTAETIKHNLKTTHSIVVNQYLAERYPNKIINQDPPVVHKSEETLTRKSRCILAQIRTNKSPLLFTYKHKIDPHTYPNPLCPLCKLHEHDTSHLFKCTQLPTQLTPIDLWQNPVEAAALLDTWALRLAIP